MDIRDFEDKGPAFRLEDFFSGRLKGWGCTVGRFGGYQNSFKIETQGHWDARAGSLTMSEFYKFDDGHCDPLNWSILKKSDIEYEGFEPSLDGSAMGEQRGNAFHWQYSREVPNKDGDKTTFGFDDWFWLIEPSVLCVSASITKLGIEVARLSAFYQKLTARNGDDNRSQG
jgi:hypothetical protein